MKLLLVDDHQMVRLGLKSYFELQDDVEKEFPWPWSCVLM